jgi:hypothetical protein
MQNQTPDKLSKSASLTRRQFLHRSGMGFGALSLAALLGSVSASCAAELLMFDDPSCVWCRRWNAEIGPGYPHSDEGRIAPLRRIDIRDAPLSTSSGDITNFIAAADFNHDGKTDLVVGQSQSFRVSVALGNGDGSFQRRQEFSSETASQPGAVVVGDFNGDGRMDFATADEGANHISVFGGLGDGSFLGAAQLFVGKVPTSLAVDDVAGTNDRPCGTIERKKIPLSKSMRAARGSTNQRATVRLRTGSRPAKLRSSQASAGRDLSACSEYSVAVSEYMMSPCEQRREVCESSSPGSVLPMTCLCRFGRHGKSAMMRYLPMLMRLCF